MWYMHQIEALANFVRLEEVPRIRLKNDNEKETYEETVIPRLNVCGDRKTLLCKH